jgi:hypothetical protein
MPGTFSTRALLACGVAAGPIFVTVTVAQIIGRRGFDLRRHGISLLSLGDRGWLQIANFVVAGALSFAFAGGVRRVLADERFGTAAPVLISGYGLGLVVTGLFLVDPGEGFPPGTAAGSPLLSWHGAVHAVAPPAAFGALAGTCVLFARRFARNGRPGWAAYSVLTALAAIGLVFWPGSGGSIRSALAVVVTSAWLTAVAAELMAESDAPT